MTQPELKHPWLVLTGLALGVCVTNAFARFAYGLLLPAMKSELGWSYAQAGWLNTANALGYLVGAIATMLLIGRMPPARLFAFGLVTTTICLLITGLNTSMAWQSALRFAAGVFGAMSFSTAGALTAQLFANDPRRNALAIAVLFGTGGGIGIVLAGATLPPMLEIYGPAAWPHGWTIIGAASLLCAPLGLWSARQLRQPKQVQTTATPLPIRAMWGEMAGYAGFGMGYIVYLTFLAAWMKEQGLSALLIASVWMVMGLCITLSPFVWRGVLERHASGRPLALVLAWIALGTSLPLILPQGPWLIVSAIVFGLSVFMAPGAVTSFARQNLPPAAWGAAVSMFTVVFAVAQIIGPYAAGWLGDLTGDISNSLIAASVILLIGATCAMMQRPLARG